MVCHGVSFFNRMILPIAALTIFAGAPSAQAQSGNPGYLPPQQNAPGQYGAPPDDQGPRSIRPPQSGNSYNRGNDDPGYGQPYSAPPPGPSRDYNASGDRGAPPQPGTYSPNEILDAGHHFFGNVSEGLAKVVEYSFHRNGLPNGYILGEEAGGAVVAGLRYGEGTLYTKGFPPQKVYWQGPSFGYDFGANGSKALTLVYNLQYPSEIYERFAGVDGSAYFVGGVGITFQQHQDVILAPIRAGLGLRIGANVGYLKYTPSPTWNPF
jgi:hypothetical protein